MNDFRDSSTAGERTVLEACLELYRAEIARLLDGLTEEEARRRLVPSLTTVMGLVKHAAFVERVWFHVRLGERSRAEVGVPDTVDASFTLTDDDTVASVLADHREACEGSRSLAARFSLDDEFGFAASRTFTLRWLHLHMVQELARHAGHGDILREQLLAAREA